MATNIYRNADGSAVYIIGEGPMGETAAPTPLPSIAVATTSTPASATEGDGTVVNFRVTLSTAVADSDTTFDYATCSTCSAVAGTDFVAASGTATIPSGETVIDIPVTLIDADGEYKPSRSFTLTISNALCRSQAILITNATGVATIVDDETFVPGASPYTDEVHPRVWIVPDGYTIQGGVTVDTVRSRVASHYTSSFQAMITLTNQNIQTNTVTTDDDKYARMFDMIACALLGILDPAELATLAPTLNFASGNPVGYAGGNTQAVYLARAKSLCLSLGINYLRVKQSDSSPEKYPVNCYMAATFSWTTAADPTLWTDADKQSLAESAILAHDRRILSYPEDNYMTEQSQKGLQYGTPLGVVLKGETITGNSPSTGQPFTTEMIRLAEDFREKYHHLCNACENWFDGEGVWHEGQLYALQAIPSLAIPLSLLATAWNENIFTQYNWLRTYPKYFLQSIAPDYYTGTNARPRGVMRKMGSSYEQSPVGYQLVNLMPFLEDAEPAMASVFYYARANNHLTAGPSLPGTVLAQSYILTSWIYGHIGKPQAAPESFPEYLPCSAHGNGEFSLRTNNKFADGTAAVVFFSAQKNIITSHQEPFFGAIELHRGGHMLVTGSTHKNFTGAPSGIEGDWGHPYLDACRLGIINLDSGPTSSTNVKNNGLWLATNPGVTAQTSHPFCSAGTCYDVTTVSDLNQVGYSYVKYDQSKTHGLTRANFHWRELIWLAPQNDGEPYLIVLDRVTVVDPTKHIPVQMWKVPKKPTIQDGASKTLIDGPGTGSALNPHTEGESGEWTTSTALWTMTNNIHGGNALMTMKHMYPTNRDGRIVGGDFNWACRDLRPLASGGRQDSNRQDSGAPSTADTDSSMTYMRNETARWGGRWRFEMRDGAAGANQLFENVIHPGLISDATPMADVVSIVSSGNLMEGGVIEDAARWRVWLRPKAHTGTTVSSAFTYTVVGLATGAVAHHVLVGLSASTAYHVSRTNSGSNATITVTPATGGSFTTTANGTLGVTL